MVATTPMYLLSFLLASLWMNPASCFNRQGWTTSVPSSVSTTLQRHHLDSRHHHHRRCPTALANMLLNSHYNSHELKVPRTLQVRAIDPSEVPAVGSNVVAHGDSFSDYGIWEYQSYPIVAIWDQAAASDSTTSMSTKTPVATLQDPLTGDGYTRFVTLQTRSHHGAVTLRLAGIYSHGLSSLWILQQV